MGFFAYERTPYGNDLWWQFAIDANAPRFLRASVGANVLLAAAALWRLLTSQRMPPATEALDPVIAARAFAEATRTDANLAFTGDKSFVTSVSGDAFLMYRVQGRTWVVMGDPVGARAAWSELAWTVRRACDAAGGRLCFYQASEAMLPLVVELGLEAIKYGEEAEVTLDRFTLDGPKAKALRHAMRRGDEAGLSFAVLPAAEVPSVMEELRAVSDAWLAAKAGAEKRFSLGPFDPDYLARFDCAVIRRGGAVVAFANLWSLPDGEELSCDLMRHLPDAPYGAMDMMFVRLFQWGRTQGYKRFNLGLAPLSGPDWRPARAAMGEARPRAVPERRACLRLLGSPRVQGKVSTELDIALHRNAAPPRHGPRADRSCEAGKRLNDAHCFDRIKDVGPSSEFDVKEWQEVGERRIRPE